MWQHSCPLLRKGRKSEKPHASNTAPSTAPEDETCIKHWHYSGTGHEIPPGSSSPSSLPPRNPPPRPPWSSAFGRLPGSCPGLCLHNGTMLLWGRETMALWDLWILKQQPSKNLPPNFCLRGGVRWKNIACGDTWDKAENVFFCQDDLSPAVWIWPDACSAEGVERMKDLFI